MAASAAPRSTKLLAKLQKQFLEGTHTDMVVRVRVEGDGEHFMEIKAHSNILSAQSAYFDRALSGDWTEAAEGRVELTVANEQELGDVKLLIKLSYSDSYAHDDRDQLLPLDTRLRLAIRADALEFVEAVDQIVASLPLELEFEGALMCITALPQALESHAGMESVWDKAAQLFTKHLGPVVGMFKEAASLITSTVPLREDVTQITPPVFKRLLASETLRLQFENEPYSLLVAWLYQSSHVSGTTQRAALFKELAPLLRYHHMNPDFVAVVVAQCPLMKASGLLPSVVHAACGQRVASHALLEEKKAAKGTSNRGVRPSDARWELNTTFTLEEVAALELDEYIVKWCGLVAGYPAGVQVERMKDTDTLGAYLMIHMPKPSDALFGAPTAGVGLQVDWALPPDVTKTYSNYFTGLSYGYPNTFAKPWAEVVREDSSNFPGGKLEVKITAKLVMRNKK